MITQERASRLIVYDPLTGIVTWKWNYQRPDLIGQRAGWQDDHGYWRLTIDGGTYYAAHIGWLLIHGHHPKIMLDHENNIPDDDRLDNLREATKGQNAANSKMNIRNTSGYKGASYCYTTGRWRADIQIHGQRKNLGRYDTPEEAHQVWLKAAQAAFGEEFVRVE